MGETVPVGETRVTVENPRVKKAVVATGQAHTRVVAHTGQYVVVDVFIDGEPPETLTDFEFWASVDGTQLPESEPFPSRDGATAYAFLFPATQRNTAAILHTPDEARIYWELPRAIRETLPLEPTFTIETIEVPTRHGQHTLELTVANEGERDGTFAARVSLTGFSDGSIIEFPVPAGESRTYTGRPGDILLYAENRGGGTLTVQYPTTDGTARIERTVDRSETTSESSA